MMSERTLRAWRKQPSWDAYLKQCEQDYVDEYRFRFNRLMPKVAKKHEQLLDSKDESITMRAVDSAHSNHGRLVREAATQAEVDELKGMVAQLLDALAQQRAS